MWLLFCCVSPRRSVFRKLSGEVKSALQDFGRPAPWGVHVMGYVSGGAASLALASRTVPVPVSAALGEQRARPALGVARTSRSARERTGIKWKVIRRVSVASAFPCV